MRLTGPQPCPGARGTPARDVGPAQPPPSELPRAPMQGPCRSNGFCLRSLFRLQLLIRLIHKELSCPGSAAGDQVL